MVPTLGINELEQLSDFRTSPTSLPERIFLLAGLTREPAFLNSRVFPLLEQAERELSLDYTPIREAIEEEVASHRK